MEVEQMKRELRESRRSHLEEREEEKLEYHKLEYHKVWCTEAERSIYNRRRKGNSSTKKSDLQIKRENSKNVLR